jgi:hypothetical protein
MAPRLHNKIVRGKGAKTQKPVPVRIVPSTADMSQPAAKRGVDKWEAQDALRTLQRAEEIRGNRALMKAATTEAKALIKALSSVGAKK